MGDKYGGTPLIWPTAVRYSYNSLDDLTRRAVPQDSGKLAEMLRDPNVRIFVTLPSEEAKGEYCNICENFPCLGNHPPDDGAHDLNTGA